MKIIVDESHNHRIVWGCWTTRKWRDEGNPNPRLQGIKCILVLEGKGTSPTTK